MLALIDGDVLVYRVGFTTNEDPEWVARARLSESIRLILQDTNSESFEIWLSDSHENWRNKIWPLYKANRKAPKPVHYEYLINLLIDEWKAEVAFCEEADDALGVRATMLGQESIVCSIDKDLKQIPGHHYDFVKGELSFVTPSQGLYKFYHQILTGDTSDNITAANGLSCPGIGPVKANRILEGCDTEAQYFNAAVNTYRDSWRAKDNSLTNDVILDKLLVTGQLIKIRTRKDEIWNFPNPVSLEPECQQQSTLIQKPEQNP